jgi:hypothetical protein
MSDAERVLEDQYDAVEEALDDAAEGGAAAVAELVRALGEMRVQVLYREARDALEEGDALADEALARQTAVGEHAGAANLGEEDAIEHLRGELAEMRSEDREVLGLLAEEGTDLVNLGEQMEVFAS